MPHTIDRRGSSKLGCAIWLVALGVFALILWMMVPVKLRSIELYDYMGEQAKFAQRAKAEVLKKRILKRADELRLPLKEKDLNVERSMTRIRMRARYTIPVEFPGYTYLWDFEHVIDEPLYIF